ncbi:MAG: winged helix family transcriptional regulator, partial [Microbacterium sp.]
MSNTALLERPTSAPARHLRAVTAPVETITPQPPAQERALPAGTAPRGFALYVGIDEAKVAASGVSLGVLVDALRRTLADLAPTAETYATVALAPVGSGGRDVDVVRLALHEPSAIAR